MKLKLTKSLNQSSGRPLNRVFLKVTNAKVEYSENETAGTARKGKQLMNPDFLQANRKPHRPP